MKRTLITGAAGFLGSHLCERFIKEGHYGNRNGQSDYWGLKQY